MPDPEQTEPEAGTEQFERCEQCHAPVDRDQRYCVNCGAHRRHVPDPAAEYMSRVTARPGARGGLSSSPAGAAVVRSGTAVRAGFSGGIGLIGALALALIPVAALVGVAIGRSSNNQDSALIRALENQRAQTTTTFAGSGTAAAGSAASSAGTQGTKKTKTASKSKSKNASASNSTSAGKVSKLTGSKVTASQQSQGSSEAKKVQSSTGKNYVQADNNLPSSVVVGP